MFVPIIPALGKFDELIADHDVKLSIKFKGLTSEPSISNSSLYMLIGQENLNIKPEKIYKSHYDNEWQFSLDFKADLSKEDNFSVILTEALEGCSIPPIAFVRKNHFFYLPFYWPFSTE